MKINRPTDAKMLIYNGVIFTALIIILWLLFPTSYSIWISLLFTVSYLTISNWRTLQKEPDKRKKKEDNADF